MSIARNKPPIKLKMPNSTELDDTSPMPWGMHKGVPMQDVPAAYLHYFWNLNKWATNFKNPCANYIRKNLEALKKENPDLIW